MSTNYDGFINETNINNKICSLHQIILTNDLIKTKKNKLYAPQYILYNNNRIIEDYYQPFMILRRKICEKLRLEYINMINNIIFSV